MLQSILNVESELRLLVASSDWRGLDYSKKDIAKEVTNIIQSTEFWSEGHEVLLVLEPLVRVLRLVDGDGSTAGYLYEAMERAKEAIQQPFLNPAYMYSGTFTENREMKEGISFILENLVALEEKIEFMGQVQLYRMKLSSLFTETAMTMLKTSHPTRDVEPINLDKLNELPEHEYVSQEQDTENDTLDEEVENINDDVIDDTDLSWLN
nr:hypothetical protein CFP56_51021 [Quercus suber]